MGVLVPNVQPDHPLADSRPNKQPPSSRGRLLTVLGVALILLSGVCFFTMLSVPLLPISTKTKAVVAGALFVGVQAFWWIGAAMVGPVAINKLRGYFRRESGG